MISFKLISVKTPPANTSHSEILGVRTWKQNLGGRVGSTVLFVTVCHIKDRNCLRLNSFSLALDHLFHLSPAYTQRCKAFWIYQSPHPPHHAFANVILPAWNAKNMEPTPNSLAWWTPRNQATDQMPINPPLCSHCRYIMNRALVSLHWVFKLWSASLLECDTLAFTVLKK